MTIHIQRFVDRLAAADTRRAKDLVLPMDDAKGLHQDITKLLLLLEEYNVIARKALTDAAATAEVVEVHVSGGSYK